MEYHSKGKRGIVYVAAHKGKKIAIKMKNPRSKALSRINIEAEFLKKLNKYGIGPRFIFFDEGKLAMEFIEGELFEDYIKKNTKKKILKVIKDILKQLHTLDKLKINKQEMHHPWKHILIRKDLPILIDFERCRYTEKPKNVSQFLHYLSGKRIIKILSEKEIKLNKEKIIAVSRDYKKHPSLKKILSIFESA